jgi:hypothetical protein
MNRQLIRISRAHAFRMTREGRIFDGYLAHISIPPRAVPRVGRRVRVNCQYDLSRERYEAEEDTHIGANAHIKPLAYWLIRKETM